MSAKAFFFSTFTDLREYCEKSVTELEPLLSEKNQAAFNSFQGSSDSINPKITEKVIEAATLQKKVDIFHMILSHVQQILGYFTNSENITKIIPNAFESVLCLLTKIDSNFLPRVQDSIEKLYGTQTLEDLKKFTHIDQGALEKASALKSSNVFVREYVYILQQLYSQPIMQSPEEMTGNSGSVNSSPVKDSSNDVSDQKDSMDSVDTKMKEETISIVKSCTSIEEEKVNGEGPAKQKMAVESTTQNWDHLKITNVKGLNLAGLNYYENIQATLLATGQKFTDPEFPPDLSSITSDLSKFPDASKIVWKRIPELFKDQKLSICSDRISPDDIHQGNLKNCYLLSALSVLSEQKHYIQRLFVSKEVTPTGCYSVWLCDSGEWKNIIVDDYIPCIYKNKQLKPYFALIKNHDIWVCILEKAFAKKHGNYMNLQNGYQVEAYHALTGAPVRSYKQKDNKNHSIEQFWTFITKHLEKNYVITTSCREDEPSLNHEAMGLVSLHAYAIMDAREVPLADGKTQRIVKLKNPWGYREWKGRWGDSSPCWTPELQKMLNYKPLKDDGVFWMSIEDLDKHFYQSFTCKVESNYKFNFIRMGDEKKKQNFFIAKMKFDGTANIYLGVQQKVRRHFGPKGSGYEYSYVRIFVVRLKDNKIVSFVQGNQDIGQTVAIDQINVSKGTFLVFVEVDWIQDIYNQINLTCYSNEDVHLSEEPIEKYDIPSLYAEILRTHIVNKRDQRSQTVQYSIEGEKVKVWKYEVKRFGVGVILYLNQEKDVEFHSSIDPQPAKNMNLYYIQGGESLNDIYVPPGGQERLIIFKSDKDLKTYKNFSFNYNETHVIWRTEGSG